MNLKIGGLCSGVGGFEAGFREAGAEIKWLVEWDKSCQSVLRRHFGESAIYGDVTKLDCSALGDVDVIVAGSPCQSLSRAGTRAGFEGTSKLFFDCLDVVKAMKPRYFLWENVTGAFLSSNGWDFCAVLCELARLGAKDISWRVLDSREFGIPQARRRIYLVADFEGESAGNIINWDTSLDGQKYNVIGGWSAAMMLRTSRLEWAESGRLTKNGLWLADVPGARKECNINSVLEDTVDAKYCKVNLESVRKQAEKFAEVWEKEIIGKAGSWPVGEALDRATTYCVSHNFCAFLTGESGTLTRDASHWIINKNRIRLLTPCERERLQGFPDGWTESGITATGETVSISDRERFSMTGNAVTCDCPAWIANRMQNEGARANKDEWSYISVW